MTSYRTIVADPPWPYSMADGGLLRSSVRHRPNLKSHRIVGIGHQARYPSMTLADLAAIPVLTLAADDAHLYLWTTNAFMVEAHEMARAWGFTPKTILTWIKPQIGTGHYFRNNTEHVVFAVRGSLGTLRRNVPTAFHAPRRQHSEKPECFIDMVESMSPGPYVELFARRHRLGWDVWGAQSAGTATFANDEPSVAFVNEVG